ncbi:MAG: hypothetical protein ACHQUC_03680 [Chlamydiales bacterium]
MSSKISFGDRAQIYFIHLNNHQDYPKIGSIGAHLLGPISVSVMRIVDIVKCIFEGVKDILGKIGWGTLLVPINLGLWLLNRKKINCSFSFTRGCKSMGKALIYFGTIPQDFLSNLIDPSWKIENHQSWQEMNAKRPIKNKPVQDPPSNPTYFSFSDIKKDPLKKHDLLAEIRDGYKLKPTPNRTPKMPLQPNCSGSMVDILQTSPLYKTKIKSMQENIVEALSELLLRLDQEKDSAIMQERWINIVDDVFNRYPKQAPTLKKQYSSDLLWISSQGKKAALMRSLHDIYEQEKNLLV